MSIPATSLHSKLIGHTAQRLVTLPTIKGSVLAVVKDSVYLENTQKEIFWLAARRGPLHPRSINDINPLPLVQQGSLFSGGSSVLHFSPGISIDLTTHEVWQNTPLDAEEILSTGTMHQRVHSLRKKILSSTSIKGLAILMPVLFEGVKTGPLDDPVLRSASPGCRKLHQACLNKNLDGLLDSGQGLIGMGNGLTPSGDDFLGGFFFALHFLSLIYPLKITLDHQVIYKAIASWRVKTNPISWTLLNDMAHGNAPEPLHSLMNSIVTNISLDALAVHVNKLTAIGHSTGWDMLTGLFCGLDWLS